MIIANDKTWFDRWWNPLSDAANILTPLEASAKWSKCRCVVGIDPSNCGLSYSPDLFDESVTDETRDKIFAVMSLMPNVAFQVVTDYPERAREYLENDEREVLIGCAAGCFLDGEWVWKKGKGWRSRIEDLISISHGFDPKTSRRGQESLSSTALLPIKNIWLGTSVRNQAEADTRVPELLMIDAPVLFLLCEPLTGPVDLGQLIFGTCSSCEGRGGYGTGEDVRDCSRCEGDMCGEDNNGISHIIAGGATGENAYPSHPDWFRDIRDFCNSKSIPFFFNGWGDWQPINQPWKERTPGECATNECWWNRAGGQGFHGEEVWRMRRVGADKSGRTLDGREWSGFPTPQEATR